MNKSATPKKKYARNSYRYVKNPSTDKQVPLHRYVMECLLCRELTPVEIVHHINGDHTNNHINNLEITTQAKHRQLHHDLRVAKLGGSPDKHTICCMCRELKPISDMAKSSKICKKCKHTKFTRDPNKTYCDKVARDFDAYEKRRKSEHYLEYQRKYREKNREKILANWHEHKKKYAERIRENQRSKYAKVKALNGLTVRAYPAKE